MKSIDQTKDGETDVKTVAQSQPWQSSQTSRWSNEREGGSLSLTHTRENRNPTEYDKREADP